ncbi:MAG: hypothetical protein RQ966_18500 [Acetobacteraceae bacterium]|nr:hypothetical protein [Acetobacteraceae bacterium]
MRDAAEAILAALEDAGVDDDALIALCALGTAVGCVAMTSLSPQAALHAVTSTARAIIDGGALGRPSGSPSGRPKGRP